MSDVLRQVIREAVEAVGDPLMCHIESRVHLSWPGAFTSDEIRKKVLEMVRNEELRMKEDCVDHDWAYRKGPCWNGVRSGR